MSIVQTSVLWYSMSLPASHFKFECVSSYIGVQVMVFGLVSSIVERLGDLVHPHASSILSWLPQVWQNSEGQGMLRMQVLTYTCYIPLPFHPRFSWLEMTVDLSVLCTVLGGTD